MPIKKATKKKTAKQATALDALADEETEEETSEEESTEAEPVVQEEAPAEEETPAEEEAAPVEEDTVDPDPSTLANKTGVKEKAGKKFSDNTKLPHPDDQGIIYSNERDPRGVREMLAQDERVAIFVPLDGEKPDPQRGNWQPVIINTYAMYVRKGMMVRVPKRVADLLAQRFAVEFSGSEFDLANNPDAANYLTR